MSSQLQIRLASPNDAAAIASIHVEGWQKAYRGLIPQNHLDNLNIPERQQLWQKRLDAPQGDQKTFVVEIKNKVLGFSSFGHSRDSSEISGPGEIYAIYIAPHCWQQGLGQQLLAASEAALKKDGHQEAILWVLSKNERAIRFYRQAGWHPDEASRHQEISEAQIEEVRYSTI
ncbi:MAG: GNAT family N-acetyltransferase [Verrucomicrobiota bacterium]